MKMKTRKQLKQLAAQIARLQKNQQALADEFLKQQFVRQTLAAPQAPAPAGSISRRGKEWKAFAGIVADHIEQYTVPQYGDAPNDQIAAWSAAQCINQISKYAARYGHNQRAGQETLDLLKIAHYACLAYHKAQSQPNKETRP